MVQKDLVEAKLSELAHRIERVAAHRTESASALSTDEDALDLVSFNLLVAVQLCLDVASHIIADEGLPVAKTSAAVFRRLDEHRVIASDLAERLIRATGFRNVVAHAYGRLDPELAFRAATEGLDDLRAFARDVGVFLRRTS